MAMVGLAGKRLSLKRRNEKLSTAFPNGVRCQKCLEMGHWSYECKQSRKYVHRISRTKYLKQRIDEKTKPKEDEVSNHTPKESKKLEKQSAEEDSSSDSESSSSDSDSSEETSSSSSSSRSSSGSSSSSTSDSDSSSSSEDSVCTPPNKKKTK